MSDHLIGHFVDQARRSGASWTDIGRSMGVTKQAAQKTVSCPKAEPDPSHGFARYSTLARSVIVSSMNEAKAAGNAEIRPVHLLLGLLDVPDGVGARALQAQEISLESAREVTAAALPPAGRRDSGVGAFRRAGPQGPGLTFRHAAAAGAAGVGTGHILLSLLEEENGDGVLSGWGGPGAAATFVAGAPLE